MYHTEQIFCSYKCFTLDTECKYRKKVGGIRKGAGRGKSGWYKGYWCDSSYELAWVIYNLDHDIPFSRNNEAFNYTFEGKTLSYYPDFIKDNCYIEIKGYMTEQTRAKFRDFPRDKKLKVLFKEDLKSVFDYVITTYGKKYIELYE